MIEGGVDLIQLRGKTQSLDRPISDLAGKLHAITSAADIPLIMNDHAVVAAKVPLEGVHVGQDDDPLPQRAKKRAAKSLSENRRTVLSKHLAAQRRRRGLHRVRPDFCNAHQTRLSSRSV